MCARYGSGAPKTFAHWFSEASRQSEAVCLLDYWASLAHVRMDYRALALAMCSLQFYGLRARLLHVQGYEGDQNRTKTGAAPVKHSETHTAALVSCLRRLVEASQTALYACDCMGTRDEPFIEYDAVMKEARAILAQTP